MARGVIGNKEKIPIKEELKVNKFAREAAACILLQGSWSDIIMMANRIEIIHEMLSKLNAIVTHEKFVFEFIDFEGEVNPDITPDKIKVFSPKCRIVDEHAVDAFLEEHDYKFENADKFYNINYEYGDDYMLIDMPNWSVLVRSII